MRHVQAGPTPQGHGGNGGAPPDESPSSVPAARREPLPSGHTNGHRNGRDREDRRRLLLRRHHRLPTEADDGGIRLRRRRRVSAPFSAVPGLARHRTDPDH